MKAKHINTLLFACILTSVSINSGYSQTDIGVHQLNSVDSLANLFLKKWHIIGAQIAMSRNEKLIYNRGFGYANLSQQTPVQTNSLFRIASVSKPITSVAVMKLYEQGKIGLDDIVFGSKGILNDQQYSNILDPAVKEITIRMLLQHTGGWNRDKSGDPMFETLLISNKMKMASPPDAISIIQYVLANQKLDFSPGTNYSYSNFGFCILGRVIEKISGMTYEDYVIQNILRPNHIDDMVPGRSLPENAVKNEVHYYDCQESQLVASCFDSSRNVPCPYGGFNIEAMDSHGEWIASAEDLVKFMLGVDKCKSWPDILKPSTVDTMTKHSEHNLNYAMGWEVDENNKWWHNGSLPGTFSEMVRTSNGMTLAILTNSWPCTQAEKNEISRDIDLLISNAFAKVNQ
jgi:CubicO group peptidase (beta-lactamase class C family)